MPRLETNVKKPVYRTNHNRHLYSKNRLCDYDGCNIIASYANAADRSPSRCAAHRHSDMINIRCYGPQCLHPGCTVSPSYGYPGSITMTHCATHAPGIMVRLSRPRCYGANCTRDATHNYPHMSTRQYCSSHAAHGMVCMTFINVPCEIEGCRRKACYRLTADAKPTRCREHVIDGMIIFCNKRQGICNIHACDRVATHCFSTHLLQGYCDDHKTDEMVTFDAVNKLATPVNNVIGDIVPVRRRRASPKLFFAGLVFESVDELEAGLGRLSSLASGKV